MTMSGTAVTVLLVKRNNTVTRSKNRPHFLQNVTNSASSYKKTIVAYGNGSFSKSIKKTSAPIRQITDVIKKMPNNLQGNTEFIHVPKAFTSQMCNYCKIKSFTNTISTGSKRKVHAILKCNSCKMV